MVEIMKVEGWSNPYFSYYSYVRIQLTTEKDIHVVAEKMNLPLIFQKISKKASTLMCCDGKFIYFYKEKL